ncbi:hypothetical protein E4U16_003619, partial [Claviceps sp. LM84 group G4]
MPFNLPSIVSFFLSPQTQTLYLSLAEQAPSTAAQDAQVLFQQEQASKVATICASLPFVDDQTVYRGLLQQVREVSEANWNQVSPAGIQPESTNQGGMTALQTSNKRRRQLDEEDEPMPQIAPGRRSDGRLIVPAALPAPKFPVNPTSSYSAVHSAGPCPSSADPSSAGPSSAVHSDVHSAGFSSGEVLLRHEAPEAIYKRYREKRELWYKDNPNAQTNEAFRRAHHWPLG